MDAIRTESSYTYRMLTTLAVAGLLLFVVRRYMLYRRLQHIPGPWWTGCSSLWLAYHTLNTQVYHAVDLKLKQYGSIVRVSPHIIVYDDPELLKAIKAPRSAWRRGHWFRGLKMDPRLDNVVSEPNEKRHAELRAKLLPGYSGKDVDSLELDMDREILEFAALIQRHIDANQAFDFAKYSSYFTLDTLTTIAFGHTAGFLSQDQDVYNYFKTVEGFFPIMELGMNVPVIQDILTSKLMQSLAGPKPSDQVGLGPIIGHAHEEIASRFGPDAKPDQPDMLGSFIRNGLTQVECESETIIQVMAGSDSTAQALRTTFWHVVSTPSVYLRLTREVDAASHAGNISFPVIKDAEAKSLPYLQACIREGVRMFMPLTGLSTMLPPPGGYMYNGMHIPEGTEVGMNLYTTLRSSKHFGPDADTFRPERFVDGDPAQIKQFEDVQDLAFGYGRFTCMGKRIALIELGKVIFELLRRYEFRVVSPLDGVVTQASGAVIQKNMMMRAWPRVVD